MPIKKWNIPDLKKKATKFNSLKESNIHSFVKKVLGAERKTGYSFAQTQSLDRGMELFNRIFQTNFKFIWKKVGEADLYERKEITSSSHQEQKKLEQAGQIALQF